MATPFLGEIRMFGGNFAPAGWAFCNGQLIAISQNDALFALIGTTYGGDGQNTFALPNMQSRIPIHQGQGAGLSNYIQGQTAGVESVTVTVAQLPSHIHTTQASTAATGSSNPTGNFWASSAATKQYGPSSGAVMSTQAMGLTGGNQPHENRMPLLAVSFIIALEGIFPSRS